MIQTDTRNMVYRARQENHSISTLRFASTSFPARDPTPMLRGSPQVPQGLPHCLQALQDMPLTNNPPGPCMTSSQANRMSWRLPATVVLLLYLSLISLSPHPVFSHPSELTATSLLPALATLHSPPSPHTNTHTATPPHSPYCLSQHHQTPPHTHTAKSSR